MATRFFTFADRYLRVRFFEEDPVIITMVISDETDKLIDSVPEKLKKAVSLDKKRKLLEELINKENTDQIINRADVVDAFAVDQIILYVQRSYIEGRSKNLQTSASGRTI